MIRKILLGLGALVVLIVVWAVASAAHNKSLPPPQLVANVVDLNKVRRITAYRSCAGHTVVPQDGREMKRNMKHYITFYPEYKKEDFVEAYAPFDGYISLMFGEDIWIAPERTSWLPTLPIHRWSFNFQHVKAREGLRIGSKVKAGEVIGYGTFLQYPEFDPAYDALYGTIGFPPRKVDGWRSPFGDLDSMFNHMSAEVLAEYERKGVTRENIIISKEERDKKPCIYRDGGPYFEHGSSDDGVDLKK